MQNPLFTLAQLRVTDVASTGIAIILALLMRVPAVARIRVTRVGGARIAIVALAGHVPATHGPGVARIIGTRIAVVAVLGRVDAAAVHTQILNARVVVGAARALRNRRAQRVRCGLSGLPFGNPNRLSQMRAVSARLRLFSVPAFSLAQLTLERLQLLQRLVGILGGRRGRPGNNGAARRVEPALDRTAAGADYVD